MRALHVLLCSHKLCGPETGRSLKRIRFIDWLNLEVKSWCFNQIRVYFHTLHSNQITLSPTIKNPHCDRLLLLSILSFKFEKNNIHHPPIKMLITNDVSYIFFETFFALVCDQPSTKSFSSFFFDTHHPGWFILSLPWDPFTAAWIWALPTIGLMRRVGSAAHAKSRKVKCASNLDMTKIYSSHTSYLGSPCQSSSIFKMGCNHYYQGLVLLTDCLVALMPINMSFIDILILR